MSRSGEAAPQTSGQPHNQEAEEFPDAVPSVDPATQERHEKLSEDVDAILDEIDDVLEVNAEDFVRAYVQKGGQ